MKRTFFALIFILCLAMSACTAAPGPNDGAGFLCSDAQSCAVTGNKLMTAKRGSAKCFDLEGNELFEQPLELLDASVSAGTSGAAAYCVGGSTVVFDDGDMLMTENAIISVSLSDCGMTAVCTSEPGYKGSVTVYSAERSAVYKWYSADSDIITAAVSPDGECLAVCTGMEIHLLPLDKETDKSVFTSPEELRDIRWLDDKVCGIGYGGVYICDDDGESSGECSFDGGVIGAFGVLDDEFIIEVREDEKSEVYIIDDDGDIDGKIEPNGSVLYIDGSGDRIIVLTQSTVSVYDHKVRLIWSHEVSGVSKAMLLNDGRILAVGGGMANILENDR